MTHTSPSIPTRPKLQLNSQQGKNQVWNNIRAQANKQHPNNLCLWPFPTAKPPFPLASFHSRVTSLCCRQAHHVPTKAAHFTDPHVCLKVPCFSPHDPPLGPPSLSCCLGWLDGILVKAYWRKKKARLLTTDEFPFPFPNNSIVSHPGRDGNRVSPSSLVTLSTHWSSALSPSPHIMASVCCAALADWYLLRF